MIYDKVIDNITDTIIRMVDRGADLENMNSMLLANQVIALFAIANELHHLNKNFKSEMDDGR